ncbi:MAG: DUF4830 domain-containing protein [Clostridia bacterium]|nr:DUF4830 domain-containing protein [Clostridia bacterium]
MFVVSIKSNKIKIAVIMIAVVVICFLGVYSVLKSSDGVSHDVSLQDGAISLRASDEKERIAFFSQLGWEIDEDPVQVKEIVIPSEFDEGMTKYNSIQKEQNFDLEDYRGVKAKQWTFNIKNYPGYENKEGYVQGNIIVYNNAVIAGDISGLSENDQFTKTLEFPQQEVNTTKPGETSVKQN